MNVNILTQFLGDFQGNSLSKEAKSGTNEFEDLFQNIESTNIETINEENTIDIDYDLILSVLNNLKLFDNLNLNEFNDFKSFENLELKNIDLESINDSLSNENLNNELSFEKNLTMNSSSDENNKLLNNIINMLQSEDANINDIETSDIKNLKDIIKNNLLNQEVNNEVSSNKTNDLNNQIEVENLNEDKYSQLEISSLNSKNNIVKEINLDDKNKDLNTLESILDGGENNNLLFPNKLISNIDTSNKESVDTQPIDTIRQEFIEEDIVKTVRYLKSNGIEEIKIKISPRELGDMTIKLIKNVDETNVHITISKEDVFELVNKNINDITKHLNELNIKFKDISVDIKSNNENIFSDNLNKEFDKKQQQGNNKKNKNKYNKNFTQIEDIIETSFEEDSLNILI